MDKTLDEEAWRIEVASTLGLLVDLVLRDRPPNLIERRQAERSMQKLWGDLEARNNAALEAAHNG